MGRSIIILTIGPSSFDTFAKVLSKAFFTSSCFSYYTRPTINTLVPILDFATDFTGSTNSTYAMFCCSISRERLTNMAHIAYLGLSDRVISASLLMRVSSAARLTAYVATRGLFSAIYTDRHHNLLNQKPAFGAPVRQDIGILQTRVSVLNLLYWVRAYL